MARVRPVLGLIAGMILILSGAAHSLGWETSRVQLAAAHVPSDLLFGLRMGWHFGGMAMIVLGLIATALFAKRIRGESVSATPAIIIAAGELAFGIWALLMAVLTRSF